MIAMKIVYGANILVAGWIGFTSLFAPRLATATVFENAYPFSEYIRLIGCLWLGIFILSIAGLYRPVTFSPVFMLQLCYKGLWLVVVALPAILSGNTYSKGMALFFVIWVLILPFVIPWRTWWLGS